jgi:hypothetical protein
MSTSQLAERIPLAMIAERWPRDHRTVYLVMLKTLQQARKEGIWCPSVGYEYNWGGKVWRTDRGSKWDLRYVLDVGVLSLSTEYQNRDFTKNRYTRRITYVTCLGDGLMVVCFPVDG